MIRLGFAELFVSDLLNSLPVEGGLHAAAASGLQLQEPSGSVSASPPHVLFSPLFHLCLLCLPLLLNDEVMLLFCIFQHSSVGRSLKAFSSS